MSGVTITRYAIRDEQSSLIYYDAATAGEALAAYCRASARAFRKYALIADEQEASMVETDRRVSARAFRKYALIADEQEASIVETDSGAMTTAGRVLFAVPVKVVTSADDFSERKT